MQTGGAAPGRGSGRSGDLTDVLTLWTSRLIDLSRRNNLLYLRDLKTGTLDLLDADPEQRTRLLAGETTRASDLFPGDEALTRARRRLTELQRRVRLLSEERGIDAGYVAIGTARWLAPQPSSTGAQTRSPVLLRPVTIRPKGTNAADFELSLSETAELNPVLTYALSRQMGVDTSGLAEAVGAVPLEQQHKEAVRLVGERAAQANVNMTFTDELVAGAFAYEKLPMVRDLEESVSRVASHPLTAALAGDRHALHELAQHSAPPKLDVNRVDPANEHLVIDADPSQQAAITAALGGDHLILQGPPGTGKSQTIANLIAEAAARGLKVLFVAQKRAAIDAVVNNLHKQDLSDLVLDLHDPKTSRKAVVEQLKASMERAGLEQAPDVADTNRRLVERRRASIRHTEVMTSRREPAGLSIEAMQQQLLDLPQESNPHILLTPATLHALPVHRLRRLEDELTEFIGAGGLRVWRGDSPWSNARNIAGQKELRATRLRLDELTGTNIRNTRRALDDLLRSSGLPKPTTMSEWGDALALLAGVEATFAACGDGVFGPDLDGERAAYATSSWRKEAGISVGFRHRRRLRAAVKARRPAAADRGTIFADLSKAIEQRDHWRRLTAGQVPVRLPTIESTYGRYEHLRDALAAVGATAVMHGLADLPEPELDRTLRGLKDDETTLVKMPLINQRRADFEQLGLAELLSILATREDNSPAAVNALRFAWLSSWLREMAIDVPEYGRFSAGAQNRVVEEFRDADVRHIQSGSSRVRRAVAQRQVHARDTWPRQRQILREQVARKARHKPTRQLVEEAPDLLLAVRPCWAMSPLVVSQVLPPRQLFDLIVFDEASQIEPADAIPAIIRGKTVVVAGDNKQLPPTPFFATTGDDDADTDTDLGDFESILDVLGPLVPTATLAWHYRSEDERLIAFSNREIYGDQLVTFPGTVKSSSLKHVVVSDPLPPGAKAYGPGEVQRVVDLVLEYAQTRPTESLGVITLSAAGANAISARLRQVLLDRPEVADFFDEDAEIGHRFFVKNIENVQGDERDAIILSVSGSRTATGALSHNFGPINQKGGERRLNVAVTRARRSMTVVSSFTHNDLIDDRLTSTGLRFLRDFLRFASVQDSGGRHTTHEEVSPIERRIVEALRQTGVVVHPRYGVARSRIDIATENPAVPGQMLLAIEIDGAEYHAAHRSVRERDRLRPQQLERMGWHHHRVWTAAWLRDPEAQLAALTNALNEAQGATAPSEAPVHLPPVRIAASTPARRLPRPDGFMLGAPIHQQSGARLRDLARWIDSDGLLRDEEEMIDEMMRELGYRRRGKNIVDTLRGAVRAARATPGAS